jgi:N-acetylglutamate synthase-like GNAT family acetyltransferase
MPKHNDSPNEIQIREGLQPGDLGYITYLHGKIYSDEYGFDTTFEPYVAKPLSDFSLSKDFENQKIWIVEKNSQIVGSIAIVKHSESEAQLRWLILTKEVRGLGIGRQLLEKALNFCHEVGYHIVFLWTVSILESAAYLYSSYGFKKTEWKTHKIWGRELTEERYDLKLN